VARLFPVLALVALLAVVGVGRAEFGISTSGGISVFSRPAITVDGAGNFIAVWHNRFQDPLGDGVFGQRLDNAGTLVGSEFQVNTYTTDDQREPAVAADGTGNFVVVWTSAPDFANGQDGSRRGVFGRRYDAAGSPLGGEFQVNAYTTDDQYGPAVAMDAAGNFVVVWTSVGAVTGTGQDGSFHGVFGRRYDSAGVPQGGDFQVNTYTTEVQADPAVAVDGAGNFVVVWTGTLDSGDIFAQRYDSAGVPQGTEFLVNSYTTSIHTDAAVAADAAGNFVVVWGGQTDVRGQRFDAAGLPVGTEFVVNTYPTNSFSQPSVAVAADGRFVATWDSVTNVADSEVFGQLYDAAGVPIGGEFQINTFTMGDQFSADVAVDGGGNFLATWVSGSPYGVVGQRNKPDRLIQGKRLTVADPGGSESRRYVLVLGRETATEVGRFVDGDPTVHGATLRVITNGTTPSDQTYVLDASGWRRLASAAYRYTGPTGGDGDPVRGAVLRLARSRSATLKALIRGSTGTQSLDLVPPNTGTDGGAILQIGNGGGTYCVAFGGAAGGTELQDDAVGWRVINATGQPGCP
jgi:hypothetical protein